MEGKKLILAFGIGATVLWLYNQANKLGLLEYGLHDLGISNKGFWFMLKISNPTDVQAKINEIEADIFADTVTNVPFAAAKGTQVLIIEPHKTSFIKIEVSLKPLQFRELMSLTQAKKFIFHYTVRTGLGDFSSNVDLTLKNGQVTY